MTTAVLEASLFEALIPLRQLDKQILIDSINHARTMSPTWYFVCDVLENVLKIMDSERGGQTESRQSHELEDRVQFPAPPVISTANLADKLPPEELPAHAQTPPSDRQTPAGAVSPPIASPRAPVENTISMCLECRTGYNEKPRSCRVCGNGSFRTVKLVDGKPVG